MAPSQNLLKQKMKRSGTRVLFDENGNKPKRKANERQTKGKRKVKVRSDAPLPDERQTKGKPKVKADLDSLVNKSIIG